MPIKDTLLVRKGRIDRKQFWLGIFVLVVVLGLAFLPLMRLFAHWGASEPFASLLASLLFYYPIYFLFTKRQHDRNRSGILVGGFLGLTVLPEFLSTFLMPGDNSDVNVAYIYANSPQFWTVQFVNLIVTLLGLYLLVVCGFLKGTDGSNQYGPDPLAS